MMIYLILGGVALICLIGGVISWRRGGRPQLPPPEPASFEASASMPPSSSGAYRDGRAGTRRELRPLEIAERAQTGLCLYCGDHASHQVPQLRLVRSLFDPLYRWLNVVPMNRWAIELHADISVPFLLCTQHHAIARSHIERLITETRLDYALFAENHHRALYEFVSFGLDERMNADAIVIRNHGGEADNRPKRSRKKREDVPPPRLVKTG